MTFQAQKPQPLVYIRTLLQYFLFQDMVVLGRLSIRQVLDDDLSIMVLPCSILLDPANDVVEAPQHPRHAIAQQMELFRQRVAQWYLDIFRSFCQNRCRVRRTLFHAVRDWEVVQMDAEEIDHMLREHTKEKPVLYPPASGSAAAAAGAEPAYSLPLSSWAYHYKLRLMEWIVQLGFELEIYQADELAGMYWYLSYLARARAQHAERIKFFTTQRLEGRRPAHPNDGARDEPHPAAAAEQLRRSKRYLRLTTLDAAVTWELADALSNLYAALGRLGLVAAPPRPYSTDALRYELRMRPFAAVAAPELPSFEAFARATTRPDTPTAALLADAGRAAAGAKKGLEAMARMAPDEAFTAGCHERWVRGVRDCLRAVIAVGLAVSTVRRAVEKKGGGGGGGLGLRVEVPRPEEGYHEWWIVPRVTEMKS